MKKLISLSIALVIALSLCSCDSSGSSSTDPFAMLAPGLTRNDIHTTYGKPTPANAGYDMDSYDVEFLGQTVELSLSYSDNRQVTDAYFFFYEYSNNMSALTFAEKVNTYYTDLYGEPRHAGVSTELMYLEWEREDGAEITMWIPNGDDSLVHVMFEFN